MHREWKLTALRRIIGDDGFTKGDEVVFNCPNPKGCAGKHHKRKLSVNLVTDAFHCWVCGWGHRSSILPILELRGATDDSRLYRDNHVSKEERPERQYAKVVLPKEFRPLSVPRRSPYYNQAMEYLAKRGIGSDDIWNYKLGYCEDGEYSNRIIIPSFDVYGELNFFVGRTIFDNPHTIKYKHGEFDKDIIFNEYMVDWHQPVTLVEGPFDAIKAGYNSIPLQGSQLREDSKLFEKILLTQRMVFIALDNDAQDQRWKLGEQLMRRGLAVGYLSWSEKYKDPGDMTKDEFQRCRSNPLVISDAFSAMRARLDSMVIASGNLRIE